MTTLPPSPILPNGAYQETTQGPLGSCITPSVTPPSSIGASTPTLSTCSSTGATPATGAGGGAGAATVDAARMTGPGRRAPVVGTSDSASVVAVSSSASCADAATSGSNSASNSASATRSPMTRAILAIRFSPFIVPDRPPVCAWISTRDGPSIAVRASGRATGSPSDSEPDYDTTLLLVQRVRREAGYWLSVEDGKTARRQDGKRSREPTANSQQPGA